MMMTAKDQGMYAPARYQEGDRPLQASTPNPNSSQDNDPNMSADVWENLREIFADLDALSDRSENKMLLKKPIMQLRRLLQIHSELQTEEVALEKVHLGVLYEREWYLRKLRALEVGARPPFLAEAAIGPPPPHEQTAYGTGQDTTAVSAFTRAVRSILYEDSNEFSLVGFRWH